MLLQLGGSYIGHNYNAKRAKKKPVDVHWVLSESDIPTGLEFIEDHDGSPGHYFLAVIERMKVEDLAQKLKIVAFRMSVIKGGGRVI